MISKYKIVRRYSHNERPRGAGRALVKVPVKNNPIAEEEERVSISKEELAALKNLAAYQATMTEYLMKRNRTRQLLWLNLLTGVAKGFGVALGITVIAFIGIKILTQLQILDLPFIGDFVADLLDYIDKVRDFV